MTQAIYDSFKQDKENGIIKYDKTLGKGSYGEIREVQINTSCKPMAAKLITKESKNKECLDIVKDLRGPNIVKIVQIMSKMIDNKPYSLVIMEKAALRDLGKLSEFFHNYNLLRTINKPFTDYNNESYTGENLLRFYVKQIVEGMEILNRYSLVHFDIKPENILINNNLALKLCDFSLLTKVKDSKKLYNIPGGTYGFISPEYYKEGKVTKEIAKKQDYFSLGCTILSILYGKPFLNYTKSNSNEFTFNNIKENINEGKNIVGSNQVIDDLSLNFFKKLIDFKPEDRLNFEGIYRSKWINKNERIINSIYSNNQGDEEKMIMELQKSDFLQDKIKKTTKRKRILMLKRL